MTDIREEYRKNLDISEDEKLFIVSVYKLGKLFYEIPVIQENFINGEMLPYEALERTNIILELMNEVRQEIKEKL